MIYLRKPENGAVVTIANEHQLKFCEKEQFEKREELDMTDIKWYDIKIESDKERSHPLPVRFEWRDRPCEYGHEGRKIYTFLLVSENEDLSSPDVYVTDKSSYDVYNFEMGKTYYWCVQKNLRRSEIRSFTTEMTPPRFIYVKGVTNVRDCGGYPVEGGGRVRQGMIYRGSEFENKMHLSPEGIDAIKRLKIKTDLDIRGEAIKAVEFPVSDLIGINRIQRRGEAYIGMFREDFKEELYKVFSDFANPDIYPVYFHCRGGADRTGSYLFILGALYGMSYDDLILDYELTTLSLWGTRHRYRPLFVEFRDAFMKLQGETLKDKARNYLKSYAGLSEEEIKSIYNIMVEKE